MTGTRLTAGPAGNLSPIGRVSLTRTMLHT